MLARLIVVIILLHTNIESLYYTPETNIMLYVNNISIKKRKEKRYEKRVKQSQAQRGCFLWDL